MHASKKVAANPNHFLIQTVVLALTAVVTAVRIVFIALVSASWDPQCQIKR